MRIAIPFLLACAPVLLIAGGGAPQVASAQSDSDAQMQRLSNGADELQAALYWRGETSNAPLIVFVHGGGWSRGDMRATIRSNMLRHWQAQGFAVASLNYRLVPDATVEQQASDVARALAHLTQNAESLGVDASRIVLAGHSAGAHLAALVGSDETYLEQAGLPVDTLRGVLALDTAAYDVPRQMNEGGRSTSQFYRDAFGLERARQDNLSPIHHAAAPNAPDFLILHINRRDGEIQSAAFADALSDAGTQAQVHEMPGRGRSGHRDINRRLGDPDYPATPLVDAWLARVLN